jgi:DNA-directed RNA polymerase II subunit RPB2
MNTHTTPSELSASIKAAAEEEPEPESDLTPQELFQTLTPEHQRNKPWWRVAGAHFESHTMTEHQIDSYDVFMREKLPGIITGAEFEYTKDDQSYIVSFENVYIKKPEFTEPSGVTRRLKPQDCRIRNLNYTCRVYTDITRYILDDEGKVGESVTFSEVYVGAIPCMVLSEHCNLKNKDMSCRIKSGECPRDPGGYFIINGSEKVLMSQDRMAHNEIFVFKSKDKDTIRLPIPGSDKNCSFPCGWSAEVRSFSSLVEPNVTSTYIKFSRQQLDKGEDQRLYMELPGLKAPVAWPIVFKALGITDTNEMIRYVCDPDDIPMVTLLMSSLECPPIESQEDALNYLADFVLTTQKDQRIPQLKRILREKMFQNVPHTHMKRFYLGHMTHQLLATVLGRRKEDDRDHYGKKRVDTAGNLINNLFKSIWKRIIREAINHLTKRRIEINQVFFGKITNYIKPPFASGNWTATKSNNKAAKVGISQILNRHNYVSTISNLRRVITPNDKNSKIIKPRHLHNSQWNLICPAETPEGQTTGLIKNLAMLTIVSLGSSEDQIIDWLEMNAETVDLMYKITDITPNDTQNKTKIFVNGSWMATTKKPEKLVTKLRKLKRVGKISFEVSISQTKEGVRVYTDEGRLLCPFFVVENGKLKELPEKFIWNDLLDEGIVEYLDATEIETIKQAEYPWDLQEDDTHALIHPSFLLGAAGSTIPFPDHNQSPRNIYQASMGKQALGVFSTNYLHRYDTNAHVLCYPQRPLVNNSTMRMMGSEDLGSGQNLIVAVMSAAYNQEDSVMINQRALDNGALRSYCYTTYSESCHRKGNTIDDIKRPEKMFVKETRLKGYNKLDADGVSKENTPLAKRDVVVGKVNSTTEMVRDTSVVVKSNGMEENAVI